MIYGSGPRTGDIADNNVPPSSLHATPYAVVNAGITHDFKWSPNWKPLTARFDVVTCSIGHRLRSGTGIGEFSPQYGARRGYYVEISQKLYGEGTRTSLAQYR